MGLLRANGDFVRFLISSVRTRGDASTRCAEWTAHDLLAHVAAGTVELADLIELALAGQTRPTRAFVEREEPYRAMSHATLHLVLVREGIRMTRLLVRLGRSHRTIAFTGTAMSAAAIARHAESELVLHRYDLVGLDRVARRRLTNPALVAHVEKVVADMDAGVLPEASDAPLELLALWGR